MDEVAIAESHFHVRFKRVSSNEYRSLDGCPKCGDGGKGSRSDRFRLFLEGSSLVWCRRCGFTAFIDNLDGAKKPTQEQIMEIRMRQIERRQEEQERQLSALQYMAQCTDHKTYHDAMQETHREYWYSEGIYDEAIERHNLGYCYRCPTDHDGRASYTIPVFYGGVLQNIRHRLVGAQDGDKYRPHRAGLGAMLFNADSIERGRDVIIWEGEKKTVVMAQHLGAFAHVGTMGKRTWKVAWSQWFLPCRSVIVAFDPDADASAVKLAGVLRDAGVRSVRVAHFPVKPDDAVNLYSATMGDIEYILRTARSV